jgi:ABC-2 type transport system ATP-binding protein
VSFEVKKGEIFGYLGPNGAGKTTTIRILLKLLEPSSGSFKIFNHNGENLSFEKIGFVLESEGLFEGLTAYENLFFWGKLYKVKNLKEKILENLEKFSIPNTNQQVGTFSKGMKKD